LELEKIAKMALKVTQRSLTVDNSAVIDRAYFSRHKLVAYVTTNCWNGPQRSPKVICNDAARYTAKKHNIRPMHRGNSGIAVSTMCRSIDSRVW